jgi:hypothetical protein
MAAVSRQPVAVAIDAEHGGFMRYVPVICLCDQPAVFAGCGFMRYVHAVFLCDQPTTAEFDLEIEIQ